MKEGTEDNELKEFEWTCFTCPENKISCSSCKNTIGCLGCKICETTKDEPCIHCDILCVWETTCKFRNHWEEEMINKRIDQTEKTKTEKINEKDKNKKEIIIAPQYQLQKVWGDTGLECISECPHKQNGLKMYLFPIVASKLIHLQTKFKNTEFLVAGNAEEYGKDTYLLTDIVIPQQSVGGASVDDIIYDKPYNTVIHKHPGTHPGGFSSNDEDTINSNHDFSIVIGSDGLQNMKGVGRVKVECGRFMKTELTVDIMLPGTEKDKVFNDSIANIKEKYATTYHYKKNEINNSSYVKNLRKDVIDWNDSYGYFG